MRTFSTVIAVISLAVATLPLSRASAGIRPLIGSGSWPLHSFKTTTSQPPQFKITKSGEPLAPGLLFFTPNSIDGSVKSAALIMTDSGELVWTSENGSYGNLFVQKLDGKPVLTMWSGSGSADITTKGHGYGKVSILDTTYNEIYTICPKLHLVTPNGTVAECFADLHESYITERGSILVTAYNMTTTDLTSVGGPSDGWVFDCLFYEIDIKTQKTLFRWSALESGIPINFTKLRTGYKGSRNSPFDWFHINAVQSFGNKYLVNSRNTWSTYLINSTGQIEWQIQVFLSLHSILFLVLTYGFKRAMTEVILDHCHLMATSYV
jgi:Arylsulfotransferase (ASST)